MSPDNSALDRQDFPFDPETEADPFKSSEHRLAYIFVDADNQSAAAHDMLVKVTDSLGLVIAGAWIAGLEQTVKNHLELLSHRIGHDIVKHTIVTKQKNAADFILSLHIGEQAEHMLNDRVVCLILSADKGFDIIGAYLSRSGIDHMIFSLHGESLFMDGKIVPGVKRKKCHSVRAQRNVHEQEFVWDKKARSMLRHYYLRFTKKSGRTYHGVRADLFCSRAPAWIKEMLPPHKRDAKGVYGLFRSCPILKFTGNRIVMD